MPDDRRPGACPQCRGSGVVGAPCVGDVCVKHGTHYIPTAHVAEHHALRPSERSPLVGQRIDGYLVVSQLGSGMFGDVLLALKPPLMMRMALKVMSRRLATTAEMLTKLVEKFQNEALSLASLSHPNIVRLTNFGTLNQLPYLVMEYVDNAETLRAMIDRHRAADRRITSAEILHILSQGLNALDAAHRQGIIHRDIKPENIMIQRLNHDPLFVRLLDFGLSKCVEDGTGTSLVAGTPTYMAAEQISGRNIGPWTDLYALAAIAFELIFGSGPFDGMSSAQIFTEKLGHTADPLRRLVAMSCPDALLRFFEVALDNEAEDRFQSAAEFGSALRSAIDATGLPDRFPGTTD